MVVAVVEAEADRQRATEVQEWKSAAALIVVAAVAAPKWEMTESTIQVSLGGAVHARAEAMVVLISVVKQ